MQLDIKDHNDTVFEWIPYNQFNEINEMTKNRFATIFSAIWEDGPLYRENIWSKDYARHSNKEVALKCLHNLQDPIECVLNEV
jgi:hypothetical protein